ncbi:MAG: hypothetical protein Q4G14_06140 [Paracoccus sp. (in: a-proteobacteria)]|uniref:hypothetical protein n=1 Tax=Paracoccus sp. TaxID=267 RepID=UPI0026DFAE60|nr:hypothetical protein [Paracoccus sp. (in: a-proteobacteria)]MDO5612810.1 hypothetical protein [Paracoccus sp. (in: a-proteobacteria)]
MPNYSKAEQKLLSESDRALTARSRGSDLTQMADAALMELIAELDTARKDAGQPGGPGNRNRYDLLNAALRRCNDERRARGLKPDGSKPARAAAKTTAPVRPGAAGPAAHPTGKPAPAKGRNATKRGGQPRKDGQPVDKRTGPRRIPKAKPPVASAAAVATPAPAAPAAAVAPAQAPGTAKPTKGPKPDKAALRAQRKADKQAAKEAEKAARKAERKAAKEAEKAARKAERQAARKAERQAAKGKKAKDA